MIDQRVQLSILITIDPGMKSAYEQYFVHRHKCTLVGRGKGRYELYFPYGTRRQKYLPHQYRYLLPDGKKIIVETLEGQQESFITLPLVHLN